MRQLQNQDAYGHDGAWPSRIADAQERVPPVRGRPGDTLHDRNPPKPLNLLNLLNP